MANVALLTFLIAFCMVAQRLSSTILTAPMVFLGLGVVFDALGLVPEPLSKLALHHVAEIALIVLLFLDAAQIDVTALRQRRIWPTRMLVVGLPLAVVLGWIAGLVLLPDWSPALLLLMAAILAPTDAALGQPVLSNMSVPERTRRALTVESGLNDGLALPLVLIAAAMAAPVAMAPEAGWTLFALKQVTLGPAVGLSIGLVSGLVLIWAKEKGTTSDVYEGIGALALATVAYLAAIEVGGNGFVAAFFAGLGFGAIVRGRCAFVYEFTESEGQLLSWTAFFLIGALLVPEAVAHLTWPALALILTSLFVVRPLAIWFSLAGTDASAETRLFFGWFGPRGLATALFALLAAEQLGHGLGDEIVHLAVNAVWISALLHGVTAAPGARLYAAAIRRRDGQAEHAQTMPGDRAYARR